MKIKEAQNIKEVFHSWLVNRDGGNKTDKTADEYIRRINRICDKLYSKRRPKEWDILLNDMYPVLFIYALCAKNWNSPEDIKIELSYDYLLNGSFIPPQDRKQLKNKKFRTYLQYTWKNKKERIKEQVAIYTLCDFVEKTNYGCLGLVINDIIENKINHIKSISKTVLSFKYIEATKTKPKRVISINEEKYFDALDLIDLLGCSRNTIQNLLKRGELSYSVPDNYLYSLIDVNEYLAKKHSAYMKQKSIKLLNLPKGTENYTRQILLLYGYYKEFLDNKDCDSWLERVSSINNEEDLQVRNDIISAIKFFKHNKKSLDKLDFEKDFMSLVSFFYEKDDMLPKIESKNDYFIKFVKMIAEYSMFANEDAEESQEKTIAYLSSVSKYIHTALDELRKRRWITLDEAKEETKLSKKTIQGLRERHKITYTQYSQKVVRYLKEDIQKIKEERNI